MNETALKNILSAFPIGNNLNLTPFPVPKPPANFNMQELLANTTPNLTEVLGKFGALEGNQSSPPAPEQNLQEDMTMALNRIQWTMMAFPYLNPAFNPMLLPTPPANLMNPMGAPLEKSSPSASSSSSSPSSPTPTVSSDQSGSSLENPFEFILNPSVLRPPATANFMKSQSRPSKLPEITQKLINNVIFKQTNPGISKRSSLHMKAPHKPGKKTKGLRHLEELSRLRRVRLSMHADPTARGVSECRLCGTCSFAGTTKFLGTFMRQHLYTHVAEPLFTCKKCPAFQCCSKDKASKHAWKEHDDDQTAMNDHRFALDDNLINLAQQCFGTSIIKST